MPYRWDPKAKRYRDPRGRFISQRNIRQLLDVAIDTKEVSLLTRAYKQGTITKDVWHQGMRQAIKKSNIQAGMLAKGPLSAKDKLAMGKNVGGQYYYLDGKPDSFLDVIDDLTEKQAIARARMYVEASRAQFEEFMRDNKVGAVWEKWILGVKEHCAGCLELAALGLVPVGTLGTVPGAGSTECLTNCGCRIAYYSKSKRTLLERLGSAKSGYRGHSGGRGGKGNPGVSRPRGASRSSVWAMFKVWDKDNVGVIEFKKSGKVYIWDGDDKLVKKGGFEDFAAAQAWLEKAEVPKPGMEEVKGASSYSSLTTNEDMNLLKEQYGTWQAGLSKEQLGAIEDYTTAGFEDLNDSLRLDRVELVQGRVGVLDEVIDSAPRLPESLVLRRDVGDFVEELLGHKVGDTFTDRGYVSTDAQNKGEAGIISIRAPKGTKGAYVAPLTYKAIEYEFLLARNTVFKVISNDPEDIVVEILGTLTSGTSLSEYNTKKSLNRFSWAVDDVVWLDEILAELPISLGEPISAFVPSVEEVRDHVIAGTKNKAYWIIGERLLDINASGQAQMHFMAVIEHAESFGLDDGMQDMAKDILSGITTDADLSVYSDSALGSGAVRVVYIHDTPSPQVGIDGLAATPSSLRVLQDMILVSKKLPSDKNAVYHWNPTSSSMGYSFTWETLMQATHPSDLIDRADLIDEDFFLEQLSEIERLGSAKSGYRGHSGGRGGPGNPGGSMARSVGVGYAPELAIPDDRIEHIYVEETERYSTLAVVLPELSSQTGLSEEVVLEVVTQWAISSNDENYQSLFLQEMLSKEFDIPVSDWQQRKIDKYGKVWKESDNQSMLQELSKLDRQLGMNIMRARKADPVSFEKQQELRQEVSKHSGGAFYTARDYIPLLGNRNNPEGDTRAVLRAMYNYTQKELASRGIKELTLFRGGASKVSVNSGDRVSIKSNAGGSWTTARAIADKYGDQTLSMTVPASRILSSARTGIGVITELEYVVLGGENDYARIEQR